MSTTTCPTKDLCTRSKSGAGEPSIDLVSHQRGYGQARLFGKAGEAGRVVALEQDVGPVRRFQEVQAEHVGRMRSITRVV